MLADAKVLAAQQRTSLTRLIEEGLHLRLRASAASVGRAPGRLPVFKGNGGLVAELTRAATSRCWLRSTMTPDINVLVAASRGDHPHHAAARTWLQEALTAAESGAAFTLMPMVLASVLRLVTSPKIFVHPTPISDAVGFVDAILSMPGVQVATLAPEWPKLRQLCIEKQLGRNDLPDAWLAAAVDQLGEHLVSFDLDFKKLLGRARCTLLQA